MPKNKGKGGKNNRRGKKEDGENKRELIFKEDGQEYAQVVKMLGNGRIDAKCQDGENRLAQIRGQMRKKVWIVVGDIILISLRDFQDDRADVIHRYTPDEARNLKTYGELKDFQLVENQEAGGEDDEEGGIEFEEADIDDICEFWFGSGWKGVRCENGGCPLEGRWSGKCRVYCGYPPLPRGQSSRCVLVVVDLS